MGGDTPSTFPTMLPPLRRLFSVTSVTVLWSPDSLVVSALNQRPRGRWFESSAGCGRSRNNRGPVALCTLGLGLTLHPLGVGK